MKTIYIHDESPKALLQYIIRETKNSSTWKYNNNKEHFYHPVASNQFEKIYITHEIISDKENSYILIQVKGSSPELQIITCGDFIGFLMSHFDFSDIHL